MSASPQPGFVAARVDVRPAVRSRTGQTSSDVPRNACQPARPSEQSDPSDTAGKRDAMRKSCRWVPSFQRGTGFHNLKTRGACRTMCYARQLDRAPLLNSAVNDGVLIHVTH
jgi:hypothetical protein